VPRDRSLEEFTGGPETESEGESSETDGEAAGSEDDASGRTGERGSGEIDDSEGTTRDADPIEAVYGFSPGGATCESCGRTVQGRWRDGERRVCVDCKEW